MDTPEACMQSVYSAVTVRRTLGNGLQTGIHCKQAILVFVLHVHQGLIRVENHL